jgi:hypothetical protein
MSKTFNTTLHPTPFGFFDNSPAFQADADKVVNFVLRKHGIDILSVELTKKMIWTAFEEATLAFNAQIISYQAKSNLVNLLGSPTGSIDPITGRDASINLTNTYIRPTFEHLIRQAEPYASEIGFGQSLDSYSGSIELNQGQQDYDLYTDLVDANGLPLSQYMSGSSGRMKIFEVYHYGPTQFVFNSNLASNFVASGLPVESWVPDTRFHILPIFEDVLRAGLLKDAQKIRRSHYRYRISGRSIRIFPIPNNLTKGFNDRVWARVGFPASAVPGIIGTDFSGSLNANINLTSAIPDSTLFGASNPANLPLGFIDYDSLNPWARNWIYQYTMAICTEMLGRVRNKFKSFPIPGSDLSLNGDDLISQGREEKQNLLSGEGGIVQKLESLTYDKIAEMEALKAEAELRKLQLLPMPPKYIISIS